MSIVRINRPPYLGIVSSLQGLMNRLLIDVYPHFQDTQGVYYKLV